MSSRMNRSDPNNRTRPGTPPQETASEEEVAQQTIEVFESYAVHRYHREQQETEGNIPMDPEIAEIQQESNSLNSLVGMRLAIIGDDINARYDSEFSEMLKSLQPSRDNAYEYFVRIASSQEILFSSLYHLEVVNILQPEVCYFLNEGKFLWDLKKSHPNTGGNVEGRKTRQLMLILFESGINWGRVIALLGFGYRMAIHVYQHGLTGFLRRIARYMADFVLTNRIAQWIAQQGGWVAALDLSNVYWKYVVAIAAMILVGQFVVRRFFSQ